MSNGMERRRLAKRDFPRDCYVCGRPLDVGDRIYAEERTFREGADAVLCSAKCRDEYLGLGLAEPASSGTWGGW